MGKALPGLRGRVKQARFVQNMLIPSRSVTLNNSDFGEMRLFVFFPRLKFEDQFHCYDMTKRSCTQSLRLTAFGWNLSFLFLLDSVFLLSCGRGVLPGSPWVCGSMHFWNLHTTTRPKLPTRFDWLRLLQPNISLGSSNAFALLQWSLKRTEPCHNQHGQKQWLHWRHAHLTWHVSIVLWKTWKQSQPIMTAARNTCNRWDVVKEVINNIRNINTWGKEKK